MVSILLAIIIFSAIMAVLMKIYFTCKDKVSFYVMGLSDGFSFSDLTALWNAAIISGLNPISLFSSLPALASCISQIQSSAENDGSIGTVKIQTLISKLYAFRAKVEQKEDLKKNLDSTRALDTGQKLRVILPGKGVFASEIVNNGSIIAIKFPTKNNEITTKGDEWVGQTVSVYLWRKNDAQYVFDTPVEGMGLFLGKPTLHLKHTSNLLRTQKRNAIRSKCHIPAQLYIMKDKKFDFAQLQTKPGYKCMLDDISVTGAQLHIRGRAVPEIQIQIQFMIQNKMVVMLGVIKSVEYNEENNQSRIHFQCIHIDRTMKNTVSNFVYNNLPQHEKEIAEAISSTEEDVQKENQEEKDVSERLENEVNETVPNYGAQANNADTSDSQDVSSQENTNSPIKENENGDYELQDIEFDGIKKENAGEKELNNDLDADF
ncbi:MAG: PilZ domain-containing protein [Treponema sp.]|nr:PilZ domain-containing protein [Treponema sp.]